MAQQNQSLTKSEPLVFISECLPQMTAGEYTVSAGLDLGDDTVFSNIKEAVKVFHVDGPRFNLLSTDIYNVYPPKGHTGHLESTLPHLVFKRRTLPWERPIGGGLNRAPWMALILLNEEEVKNGDVKIETRSLTDLLEPKTGITGPAINITGETLPLLSPWELNGIVPADIKCDTIDLNTGLFEKIAPRLEELPFLAHVRKVEVDKNKEQADNDDDGYFSVLMCNRLPTRNLDTDVRNSVFLVSLEGFHNHLNGSSTLTSEKVRLVVLHHWSFNIAPGKNFEELCDGLQAGSLKMNYDNGATLLPALKSAYDYGYTALEHTTRIGSKTISWYRGPFNPNFLPTEPQTRTFSCADNALRYDHENGLLDVSYAAAWQLGRLLALKDKEFSFALQSWKTAYKQNTIAAKFQGDITNLLPGIEDIREEDNIEDLVKNYLQSKYDSNSDNFVEPKTLATQSGTQDIDWKDDQLESPPVPTIVSDWLGKLFLLHGVPFNYLVAHEKVLQKETLATFYLDFSWVEALLDGALSISRNSDSKLLLNKIRDGQFLPKGIAELKTNEGEVPVQEPDRITGQVTGFLLRSELISGWKGVKIYAKGTADEWLVALRLERIEDDVLLCIFNGKVASISFIEPTENLHFGLEQDGNRWVKKIRNSDGSTGPTQEEIPLRDSQSGVLNILDIPISLKSDCSADFAYQMIENPTLYTLNIDEKS